MEISNDIKYIGVNDHTIDMFEGQYIVPNGMSYNSYVILDDKIAVLDTVDLDFKAEWLNNLDKALNGRVPDYLIVHHMEPDHSSIIKDFTDKYNNAVVVASMAAFNMMKNMYGQDYNPNKLVVKEGDELPLGKHTLRFVQAPNVHWPEVIMSYDMCDKVLFSADAFGKFGANDIEDPEGWACEARRYYFGIVGRFGVNVQNVLKKLQALEINTICSLHGPVLNDNISYYIGLYDTWSKYEPEAKGVSICYTSVYGNTKNAVLYLEEKLKDKGVEVEVFDLARDDMAEAIESAFELDRLVLATTTYNGGMFPFMETFINTLAEHNYQNRRIALVENGMWGPMANKAMKAKLEGFKDITFAENNVTIKGALNDEYKAKLDALADELAK
ncbi:MAG: FprA family A-type flavoprotein [Acholeplasmatales bacterium]|nr:FprA family A-type flavoprotein [Acholeplasmatales bacterium]